MTIEQATELIAIGNALIDIATLLLGLIIANIIATVFRV